MFSFAQDRLMVIGVIGAIFLGLSNLVWIAQDQSPPLWDMAGHSSRSVVVGQEFRRLHPEVLWTLDTFYPPFTYVVTGVFFVFAGFHEDIPQFSLTFFFIIFLLAMVSLGRDLGSSVLFGLCAGLLTLLMPMMAHFSRIYDLDFPLTAMVTSSLAAAVRMQRHPSKSSLIFFSFVFSAALLTKWTALFYLSGPFAFLLWEERKTIGHHWKTILRLAWIPIVLFSLIVLPWYFLHAHLIWNTMHASFENGFSVPVQNIWSYENFIFYPLRVARGMVWPLALFVPVGIVFGLWFRTRFQQFCLLWIFIPWILLTIGFATKDGRYLLPVYPAIALLTGNTMERLKPRFRVWGMSFLMFLALFFWADTTWNIALLPKFIVDHYGFRMMYGYQFLDPRHPSYGFPAPTSYHREIKKIPQAIMEEWAIRNPSAKMLSVAIVPNSVFLSGQQIQFYARVQGFDHPDRLPRWEYQLSSEVRKKDWKTPLQKADFFVTKTGDQGPPKWNRPLYSVARAEQDEKSKVFRKFSRVRFWELAGIEPDPISATPTEARLYVKKSLGTKPRKK